MQLIERLHQVRPLTWVRILVALAITPAFYAGWIGETGQPVFEWWGYTNPQGFLDLTPVAWGLMCLWALVAFYVFVHKK